MVTSQHTDQAKPAKTKVLQAKLQVNKPGDQYENEADRVADQVVQMQRAATPAAIASGESPSRSVANQVSHFIQRQEESRLEDSETETSEDGVLQQKSQSSTIQRQEEDEQAPHIQAKEDSLISPTEAEAATTHVQREEDEELAQKKGEKDINASPQVEQQINASKGNGRAMSSDTLQRMNSAFGTDFSNVRIHTDQNAVQLNQQLHARAFTVGKHIYFNSGEYNPESTKGTALLAHELTHTIQQGAVLKIQREGEEEVSVQDSADEEIKKFIESMIRDYDWNLEREMEDWEEKNPDHTPQQRAEKLRQARDEELKYQQDLNTDEHIKGAGFDPALVRDYLVRKQAELSTNVERGTKIVKEVSSYPVGYETKYAELKELVNTKIDLLSKKISKTTEKEAKYYYQVQMTELQATQRYLQSEDTKKYISLRVAWVNYLDILIKEINTYPLPYDAETAAEHVLDLLHSARVLDSYSSDISLELQNMYKGEIKLDLALAESLLSGGSGEEESELESSEPPLPEKDETQGDGTGGDGDKPTLEDTLTDNDEGSEVVHEEDPELTDDQIAQEEEDEIMKEFLEELKGIATVDESLESDQSEFWEKIKEMSPEEQDQFLEYLRGILDTSESPDDKRLEVKNAFEKFSELSEIERKILDTNRKLRTDSSNAKGDDITVDLGELMDPTNADGKTAQELIKEMSKAESVLNQIKEQAGVKGQDVLIDLGWSPFITEMSVFYALLAGAGKRSAAIKEMSFDLMENIKKLKDELNKQILQSAALAIPAALLTPAGPAGAALIIGPKLLKVKKLFEVGQSVFSVGQKVQSFAKALQNPQLRSALTEIEIKMNDLASLEKKLSSYNSIDDEGLEDMAFELEEQLRADLTELVSSKGDVIMEFLYIPEPENAEPDAIIDELVKILYDLPKGLASFEAMSQTYESLKAKGDPSQEELALMSLQAVDTGVYLYPFVGFLAETTNNALDGLGDADFFSLFGGKGSRRRSRKYKKASTNKDQRKKDTKEKFARTNTKNYDYDKADLKDDYLAKYERLFEAYLNKPENALHNGYWTAGYFKYVARDYYKELKKEARKETVDAVPKKSKNKTKVKAPAPPFKLTDWKLKGSQFSFKLKVNPTVDVESLTDRTIVYKTFQDAGGIPYTFAAMGSTKNKRIRKKELKKWLAANGYEFTYEGDSKGNPIRNEGAMHIRRGVKQQDYLHLDKGVIKTGVHTDINKAYKNFFGKKIKKDLDLPEGYVLKRSPSLTDPGRKAVSKKKNLPSHMPKINWDGTILTKDAPTKTPTVVKPLGVQNVTDQPYNYIKSIESMFDITTGKPEVPKAKYNMQKRNTIDKWKNYLEKHKYDANGIKRPIKVEADFGYTINARANGDNLSKYKLPEMKTSDDNGHLVARRFGAVEFFNNLVPMDRHKNQKGAWSKMEHEIAQKYVGRDPIPGNYVHATIDISYTSGDTRRPSKFDVEWEERTSSGTKQSATTGGAGSARKVEGNLGMTN